MTSETASTRHKYILEYYRTARAELMHRVGCRDGWLRIALLSQAVLLGLAYGVRIAGVEAQGELPQVLVLTAWVSLVCACCYYVEDYLIGLLSEYVAAIAATEGVVAGTGDMIMNWDSSAPLLRYSKGVRLVRATAQIVAFLVIPAVLLLLGSRSVASWSTTIRVSYAASAIALAVIGLLAIYTHSLRIRSGQLPTRADSLIRPLDDAS